MIQAWIVLLVAVLYLSILFAVASHGDRTFPAHGQHGDRARPNIYAFSLAIYCTTWTFFGSVGLAATRGVDFLAIYVGPILVITLGFPLIKRIIKLSKQERITSVADFLGSRYGKNLKVAGVAAIIAVIGTVPYIALQLKAISASVSTLIFSSTNDFQTQTPVFGDISILIALTLALFSILFGTRHADATEHQHGLMLAIAMESVVKLIAFLSVGAFVTFIMFDGVTDLFTRASQDANVQAIISKGFDAGNFFILTLLSLIVFLLLPRQFHVAVVENNAIKELERARWLFPLYLVAINLFVIPIALAGTIKFGSGANADDFVLLLPMLESEGVITVLAFIGGLSAGTAMVVVACVALAIMISNDLVLPMFLRSRASAGRTEPEDMENRILNIRRTAILVVLLLAYVYYKAADNSAALASIGLVSFAAIAQLAPAFFGGLFWKRATAGGAMAGMTTGFIVWAYCLLLPTLLPGDSGFVQNGLFGWSILKPQSLFEAQFSPLANGVIWSLAFNTFAFVTGSLVKAPEPLERMQASVFADYQLPASRPPNIGKSEVTIADLMTTVGRYVGTRRTERAFDAYWQRKGERPAPDQSVDNELLRHSEQLLASAIGASSSRLVHTLLIKRFDRSTRSNIRLLDQASKALQFNRDVLQTALDEIEQGITVFDLNFKLASWNRQFRTILNLPAQIGQVGIPLSKIAEEIVRTNSLETIDITSESLANKLINQSSDWRLNLVKHEAVIEVRTSPMPDGGIVVTWNDVTEKVQAERALQYSNETLERRVEERTRELEEARQAADRANVSKTRFLAAAGHDILQPLNAARLYSSTLSERSADTDNARLADNVGRSLESVEEIFGTILEISRLDSATPDVNRSSFPLSDITEQLQLEFDPIAKKQRLSLVFVHSSLWVHSDKALLRRLLQNLISNALKFTNQGKVLVGCRRRGANVSFEVFDTGIGMTKEQQAQAFNEFTRLAPDKTSTPGIGLGLSIVQRISELLEHEVRVSSDPGRGTRFSIELPVATAEPTKLAPVQRKNQRKPGDLTGTRILCIDNEESILKGMQSLLTQWGCIVSLASGPEEAVQRISESAIDIVLADYHLETSTGVETVRMLRETCNRSLPAILITADRSEEVKQQAREINLAVLNKPIRPAALRAMIFQEKLQREAAE